MEPRSSGDSGIEQRLVELEPYMLSGVTTELGAVAVAIAVEDAFDLELADGEINPDQLGSIGAIRDLVLRRRSAA